MGMGLLLRRWQLGAAGPVGIDNVGGTFLPILNASDSLFGICGGSDDDDLALVVGLLQEQEQKNEHGTKEYGRVIEDPLPSLIFSDEAADDGGEKVASCQGDAVQAHICTTLVGEDLSR